MILWYGFHAIGYITKLTPKNKHCPKTLFVHIVVIASVLYLCYCSTEVQMYCLLLFPPCLPLTWSIFFSKEMDDAQTHFETQYYGWFGLVLFSLRCPISSPKHAYQCRAVFFNFEKPPIPVLQIFQNQRITDSVLWKKK